MSASIAEKTYRDLAELFGGAHSDDRQDTISQRLRKVRDLTLVRVAGPNYLVLACDSDGGIGPKPQDTVYTTGYWLGRVAARVPLMEVLASGATPLILVDALGVEMEPTGKEIIRGIRVEAAEAGLVDPAAITGSTEDNVPTVATGIGVTVIGVVQESHLRPGTSRVGDAIVAVGKPKSAPDDDVTEDDPEIADLPAVRSLLNLPYVRDILPVGSKGIAYEAGQMAQCCGLDVALVDECSLDIKKSAGPSTCVLASLPESMLEELAATVNKPVSLIGRLLPHV